MNSRKPMLASEPNPGPIIAALPRLFLSGDEWKQCGRRVPRAQLGPGLVPVWIAFPAIAPRMKFAVRTLGELGCYCLLGREGLPLGTDHVIDVLLMIEGDQFEFEGRVRYVDLRGVAIEFVHPDEEIRARIRALFEPEFLAAMLAPLVSYTTVEPGSTSTMIYSDGEFNNLQIGLMHKKISALNVDLRVIQTHLEWRKTPTRVEDPATEKLPQDIQNKVLGFVRNLPGLDKSFLRDLEMIISREKFRRLPPAD